MQVGKTIQEIRLSHNLTQAQLAQKAGVSRHTIVNIENDATNSVQMRNVELVLGALGYGLAIAPQYTQHDLAPTTRKRARRTTTLSKSLKRAFLDIPEVVAAYPIPESREDIVHLAVVVHHADSHPRVRIRQACHNVERESNRIVDFLPFTDLTCPPCKQGEALYDRDGDFSSAGDSYDPYNLDDPINESKLNIIEQFADAIESDPSIVHRLQLRMHEGKYFHDDRRREYEDDWNMYICEYPIDLLVTFLRSRCAHLSEICASSPILMFQNSWKEHFA